MLWFVVLLLIAGAGFYFYQKMLLIEREIRAEQAGAPETAKVPEVSPSDTEESVEDSSESVLVTPVVENMTPEVAPVGDADFDLADEVLAAVNNLPGIKQTELYVSFADINKKQLQITVKDLADQGQLKREKQGSSYLLYPV